MTASMIADYKAGMTLREIANKYYVSHTYIYHYLPKNVRRKEHMTDYHKDVIVDYKQGMPLKDISFKYSITKDNVYHILKRNNIQLRKGKR